MANEEHVTLLKQGVDVLNSGSRRFIRLSRLRPATPPNKPRPDLSGCSFAMARRRHNGHPDPHH